MEVAIMESSHSGLSLPSMEDSVLASTDLDTIAIERLVRTFDDENRIRSCRMRRTSALSLDIDQIGSGRLNYDRPANESQMGARGKVRGERGDMDDLSFDNSMQRAQRLRVYLSDEEHKETKQQCLESAASEATLDSDSSVASRNMNTSSMNKVSGKLSKIFGKQ